MTKISVQFQSNSRAGGIVVTVNTNANMSADFVAHDLIRVALTYWNYYRPGMAKKNLMIVAASDKKHCVYFDGDEIKRRELQ